MTQTYFYSLGAFPGAVDPGRLEREIVTNDVLLLESAVFQSLGLVSDNIGTAPDVEIAFSDALSPAGKLALDGIVATLDPSPFDASLWTVAQVEKVPGSEPGEQRYVTDCRLPGEGVGAGTGCWCWWQPSSSTWRRLFDNGPVEA